MCAAYGEDAVPGLLATGLLAGIFLMRPRPGGLAWLVSLIVSESPAESGVCSANPWSLSGHLSI